MPRYHTSVPHLWCIFWDIPRTGVVVGDWQINESASIQRPLCDDDHLQWRAPSSALRLPAAPVPADGAT